MARTQEEINRILWMLWVEDWPGGSWRQPTLWQASALGRLAVYAHLWACRSCLMWTSATTEQPSSYPESPTRYLWNHNENLSQLLFFSTYYVPGIALSNLWSLHHFICRPVIMLWSRCFIPLFRDKEDSEKLDELSNVTEAQYIWLENTSSL